MTRLPRISESQAIALYDFAPDGGPTHGYAQRAVAYVNDAKPPARRPRGLIELLRWYEAECWACVPEDLHKRELWHDYVRVTDEVGSYARQGGGSKLGTLAWDDAFRQLLEKPDATDGDGHYHNPMAAALRSLEGQPFSDGSLMASYLRAVACAGFTYSGVADRLGIPPWVSEVYTVGALERLWRAYREEPKARVIREVA